MTDQPGKEIVKQPEGAEAQHVPLQLLTEFLELGKSACRQKKHPIRNRSCVT